MEYKKLNHHDVLRLLPDRVKTSHKGTFGRILLLCGSVGFTGAAALASMGALRAGAGLVYLGVPESIYAIEACKLLEPIVIPLSDELGMISSCSISRIATLVEQMDAVLIGPGIGQSEGTFDVVTWLVNNYNGPLVLDADGINVMKDHKDVLRGRTSPTILTPHEGEFSRFGGSLSKGRINGALELAKDLDVIVVLKGHNTVITDGQLCYINTTGNPGMAVAGSGDILAGMIAALLGQGIKPIEAAAASAWLHGAAGDICAKDLGEYGMLPVDMLTVLPRLLK